MQISQDAHLLIRQRRRTVDLHRASAVGTERERIAEGQDAERIVRLQGGEAADGHVAVHRAAAAEGLARSERPAGAERAYIQHRARGDGYRRTRGDDAGVSDGEGAAVDEDVAFEVVGIGPAEKEDAVQIFDERGVTVEGAVEGRECRWSR